ncbi:MAG TPA: SPOR domain-containing protein [Xanthobacteraceae bacterium]|nr:SPOR domain-containing protein [Xanthobacteraceae bacterium]
MAAFLSALATERANSAKAPIEVSELRTGSSEVARLKETIDRLLVEQQRLALRVEDFERTQSDLTAATPVDRKNVAWGPPPYPYGLKVKQKGGPTPVEVRDRDVPIPPASIPRDKDAGITPLPPREKVAAVPIPPTPPREKEIEIVPPLQPERESAALMPQPLTEKDLGLAQLPAARVAETPRIMEMPRGPETPRPMETARVAEPPRVSETPRAIPAPPVETTQAIVTRTEFALDLGGETSLDGLRARWASLRGNHGKALENMKPLVALREADQPGAFDFRLLVGPIANAADAARACARLNTTKIICAVTTYDGQHVELR